MLTLDHLPQGVPRVEAPVEDAVGGRAEEKREEETPVRDPGPRRRGYSQAVLDFLSATDVGRLVPSEEGAGSDVSGRELRELREREDGRRADQAEELGVAGELGAGGGATAVPTHAHPHGIRRR